MNEPRLGSLKQCTFITHSFCGSGIQAHLNWVLCFEVSRQPAVSSEGTNRAGSASTLMQIFAGFFFLRTVEIRAVAYELLARGHLATSLAAPSISASVEERIPVKWRSWSFVT